MSGMVMGITDKNDRYPPRGERIARWAEAYMRQAGLSVGELAFKLGADKRDVRRLLAERSCGPRLNDAFEETFGHDFMDDVASPLVGGDRIAVLEREIAIERNKIAALDARIEREKAARQARGALSINAAPGRGNRLAPAAGRRIGA